MLHLEDYRQQGDRSAMNDKSGSYIVNIGRFLLLFVGMDVLLTSILFFLHINISKANFFIALLISIVLFFLISRDEVRRKSLTIAISCVCLLLIICATGLLYEIAFDGNLYHKFAAGILKLGYNPVYEGVEDYLIQLNIPEQRWYNNTIWVECYPKASWYFNATIYAVTNWIESAKVFNLLIFISSFGICYDYFYFKLPKKYAYCITFLLIATPTSIAMLTTFYLDGALGNLLITSIVLLMSITDDAYERNKILQFVYLGVCIILCGNLKITGLAYEGAFCFSFFVMWSVRLIHKNDDMWVKKLGKIALFYIGVVCITVFIVGYGVYITNIMNYGNALYPLGELEGFDTNNNLKSIRLEYASPLIQILSMIFVKTNTNDKLSYLEWKIPFTFEIDELKNSTYDVIRGGTGTFYSGILCIAIVMFLIWNWKFRKNRSIDKKMVYLIMIISFLLICIVPAGGQTRYSPYIFYFVTFTIYLWMLEIQTGNLKSKVSIKIPYFMFILLLINLVPFTNYSIRMIRETINYNEQFELIEQNGGAYIDTKLPGLVFNFIDRNIQYVYAPEVDLKDGNMKYFLLDYNFIN